MENFTTNDIAEALGTTAPINTAVDNISTDTRAITENCVFVALKGERFDGHDFAKSAFESGAAAIVSERQIEGIPCIITDNTTDALLKIAKKYRERFSPILIGITGSVGKTTTKDMIALVLGEKFKTLKTQGNFNNNIGLPKTLFNLDSSHGAAVIEMGMNHFGEIDALTKAAMPDIAVITNIGWSHVENLGSREGILRAKLEILNGMKEDAPLITNADDEYLCTLKETLERPVITYGICSESADIRAVDIKNENGKTCFDVKYGDIQANVVLNAVGTHNILNALAAFAVGICAKIDVSEIVLALSKFKAQAMRQNIIETESEIRIIADCYNASPDSMKAALEMLDLTPGKRKIAVLGDMLELGAFSQRLHTEVGKYVGKSGAECVFCYGAQSAYIARSASLAGKAARRFFNPETLGEALKSELKPGDTVLFKASRGMHLENVIKALFGEIIS